MAALFLGVAAYFGIEAFQYLDDPLGVTLAYRYEVEQAVDMTGYVVREERVLPPRRSRRITWVRTVYCTVGNATSLKRHISRKAGLYLVVTGTRLNVTAAGQSVKSWKKGIRTKSTMPKWSV